MRLLSLKPQDWSVLSTMYPNITSHLKSPILNLPSKISHLKSTELECALNNVSQYYLPFIIQGGPNMKLQYISGYCSEMRWHVMKVGDCSSDAPMMVSHAYSMTNQLTISPLSDGSRLRQKYHTNTHTHTYTSDLSGANMCRRTLSGWLYLVSYLCVQLWSVSKTRIY